MTMIHLNTFSDALLHLFSKKNEKNYFSGSKNEFRAYAKHNTLRYYEPDFF